MNVSDEEHKDITKLSNESVVTLVGKVVMRPEGQENPSMGESGRVAIYL